MTKEIPVLLVQLVNRVSKALKEIRGIQVQQESKEFRV